MGNFVSALSLDFLLNILKLYNIALFVSDPPCACSTLLQNPHLFHPPTLYCHIFGERKKVTNLAYGRHLISLCVPIVAPKTKNPGKKKRRKHDVSPITFHMSPITCDISLTITQCSFNC